MNSCVPLQGIALAKGTSTADPQADERSDPRMSAGVYAQGSGLSEGACAAFPGAGKGFFSGMNPLVCFQVREVEKGFWAVRGWAAIGPLSCMAPLVCFQIIASGKGLCAADPRAGKGPCSGVTAPCPIEPAWRICRVPDLFMAGDRASCMACSPAHDRSGLRGQYGCNAVRDRGIVHGRCRSGSSRGDRTAWAIGAGVCDRLTVSCEAGPCLD